MPIADLATFAVLPVRLFLFILKIKTTVTQVIQLLKVSLFTFPAYSNFQLFLSCCCEVLSFNHSHGLVIAIFACFCFLSCCFNFSYSNLYYAICMNLWYYVFNFLWYVSCFGLCLIIFICNIELWINLFIKIIYIYISNIILITVS